MSTKVKNTIIMPSNQYCWNAIKMYNVHAPNLKEKARISRSFTLVELLIVIAIISILISMLMPALRKASETAGKIACSNNAKQIALSFFSYIGDANGYLVPEVSNNPSDSYKPYWHQRLINGNYITDKPFRCPAMPEELNYTYGISYGINRHLYKGLAFEESHIISSQKYSSKKILIVDTYQNNADGSLNKEKGHWRLSSTSTTIHFGRPAGRHCNSCNSIWLDGHCDSIKIKNLENPCFQSPFSWTTSRNYLTWETYPGYW